MTTPKPRSHAQPRPPGKRPGRRNIILAAAAGLVVIIVVVAVALSGGNSGAKKTSASPDSSASSSTSGSAAAGKKTSTATHSATATKTHGTLTYVVTGSAAEVIYGPSGSRFTGAAPLRKSASLTNAPSYAISAQLRHGGTVRCEILVGRKVIAKSVASGGVNVASCEIDKDPRSGQWRNDQD